MQTLDTHDWSFFFFCPSLNKSILNNNRTFLV
jgi:hypothetical protein